jgi:hypothetical protein
VIGGINSQEVERIAMMSIAPEGQDIDSSMCKSAPHPGHLREGFSVGARDAILIL